MREIQIPAHLVRSMIECEINPDNCVFVEQVECPIHIGREGRFMHSGKRVEWHTHAEHGKATHVHGKHIVCGALADVYSRGLDGAGVPHYHLVCAEGHVSEFGDAGLAGLRTPRHDTVKHVKRVEAK